MVNTLNGDDLGTGWEWSAYYQLLDAAWVEAAPDDGPRMLSPLICRIDRLLTAAESESSSLRLAFGVPRSDGDVAFAEVAVYRPIARTSSIYQPESGPRTDKRHYPGTPNAGPHGCMVDPMRHSRFMSAHVCYPMRMAFSCPQRSTLSGATSWSRAPCSAARCTWSCRGAPCQ